MGLVFNGGRSTQEAGAFMGGGLDGLWQIAFPFDAKVMANGKKLGSPGYDFDRPKGIQGRRSIQGRRAAGAAGCSAGAGAVPSAGRIRPAAEIRGWLGVAVRRSLGGAATTWPPQGGSEYAAGRAAASVPGTADSLGDETADGRAGPGGDRGGGAAFFEGGARAPLGTWWCVTSGDCVDVPIVDTNSCV